VIRAGIFIFFGLHFVAPTALDAADKFDLREGDRVVLLGNTLIEREQRYGCWETGLTRRYPDRNIIFRNLGWSGDTVFGHARAGFGDVAHGFRQLKEHVLALKPTVIIIGYGLNESFQGEAGLPEFRRGLTILLDTLAPNRARIVLLSPQRQEDLGRPLPDPAEQNRNVRLYADALRHVAVKRGYGFVDLYALLADGTPSRTPAPLTDNGIHFTAYGYWRSEAALESGLGRPVTPWRMDVDVKGNTTAEGTKLVGTEGNAVRFRLTDALLPAPRPPKETPVQVTLPGSERLFRVRGLEPGRHVLRIDGKAVKTATADDWAKGVELDRGPEFDQVEKLRRAIIAKNLLYFHRWRPQNETYLFGFRKHEQGKNAQEIVQFDPLIARAEKEIAKLRVPVPHQYELIVEPKDKRTK
jgi:lysophospholipase L1-like esterase